MAGRSRVSEKRPIQGRRVLSVVFWLVLCLLIDGPKSSEWNNNFPSARRAPFLVLPTLRCPTDWRVSACYMEFHESIVIGRAILAHNIF